MREDIVEEIPLKRERERERERERRGNHINIDHNKGNKRSNHSRGH